MSKRARRYYVMRKSPRTAKCQNNYSRIYFHGPPMCTIHRSVSGDAITSNGIQK